MSTYVDSGYFYRQYYALQANCCRALKSGGVVLFIEQRVKYICYCSL